MIEESKYSELEAQLRKAHRRSWLRFFIFLGFVLALWIATYVVTKGQFTFFTKKIAVIDTLVINQDSALAARDSIIRDQARLIKLILKDTIHSKVTPTATGVQVSKIPVNIKTVTIEILNKRISKNDSLLRIRDIDLKNKRSEYDQNAMPLNIKKQ